VENLFKSLKIELLDRRCKSVDLKRWYSDLTGSMAAHAVEMRSGCVVKRGRDAGLVETARSKVRQELR